MTEMQSNVLDHLERAGVLTEHLNCLLINITKYCEDVINAKTDYDRHYAADKLSDNSALINIAIDANIELRDELSQGINSLLEVSSDE